MPADAVPCQAPGVVPAFQDLPDTSRWYYHPFDKPASPAEHWEIVVEPACVCEVWLNGHRVGSHEAPYIPVAFVVGAHLAADANLLAIRCHGALNALHFQGPVLIEGRPASHIESFTIRAVPRKKKAFITLAAPENATIQVTSSGKSAEVEGTIQSFQLPLTDHKPWSLEEPTLHEVEARIDVEGVPTDLWSKRFGHAEFNERDCRLTLNGKPVYLKGICYDPVFSVALEGRDLLELAQADVAFLKDHGFNALLCSAPPPRALLQAADEAGMLVGIEIPEALVTDESLEALVDAYTEHPSLAFWRVVARDTEIRDRLRNADPDRLLLAFDPATDLAHFSRPHQTQWEPFEDLSVPLAAPVDYREESYCRHAGDARRLSLVTSFGYPAPGPAFAAPVPGAEALASNLEAAVQERALDRVFGDLPSFVRAASTPQCDVARLQMDAFRGNTRLAGYFYARYADPHPAASSGIVDAARQPKLVAGTVKLVQRPLRPLIQMSSTNLSPRAEATVSVVMANEMKLEERADLVLLVVGPTNQVLWKKRRSIKIVRHGKELWSGAIAASGSTGPHRLVVRLVRGSDILAEASQDFLVVEPPEKAPVKVHLLDPRKLWVRNVQKWCLNGNPMAPIHLIPRLANTIRAYPENELLQIFAQIKGGAAGIVLGPPRDWNDLVAQFDPGLALDQSGQAQDDAVLLQYAKLHPLFEGLPNRCMLRQPYRQVAPRQWFEESVIEESSGGWVLPDDASAAPEQPPVFANGIVTRRHGSGRILFLHHRFLDALEDDPVAARFFVNLITFVERRSVPPSQPLAVDRAAVEWLRRERLHQTRRWAVLGTFPNDRNEGHDEAYPPEAAINLEERCPGTYEVLKWRNWHSVAAQDHRIDLDALLSPLKNSIPARDHGTAYAYAEFTSDIRHEARVTLRSPNALKVWMNGTMLFAGDEPALPQAEVPSYIKLGKNTMLVKCSKGPGPFWFELDLFSESGKPLQITWWREARTV